MTNTLDKQYIDLLQDILDNGVKKETRNGGTISVFGRQIRHKMSEGFPLLTTKKMPFRLIATELMWFLRGDTNIKYLVDNGCNIWNGDAFKNYDKFCIDVKWMDPVKKELNGEVYDMGRKYDQEGFINRIKTDDEFAEKWGNLGPIYGKQWREWNHYKWDKIDFDTRIEYVDQIANLINDLKTNPDSRRLMVTAWNPADLPSTDYRTDDKLYQDYLEGKQVLPPCHYGFQVYTRELSLDERRLIYSGNLLDKYGETKSRDELTINDLEKLNIPTRAISLMWNQRSVDTFLGLPFNIASYGLLLEIIAKVVNMVPDELIGNLGDTHLYLNHIEQAKEQIGRELTIEERIDLASNKYKNFDLMDFGIPFTCTHEDIDEYYPVERRTREPFPLPSLNINTEFWSYEGGECGEVPLDAIKVFDLFKDDNFCKCLLEEDLQLGNYQSHPTIKAPLTN